MNQDINPLELVIRDLAPSQTPAIILPANPTKDAVYAGIILYLGLNKLGKHVSLVCSTAVSQTVPGAELIKTTFGAGGRNLVISFPYVDGSVEKVDYRIENEMFNLIVIPREGYEKITQDMIKYSYSGSLPDAAILVGSSTLQSLGEIYTQNEALFQTIPLAVIHRQRPTAPLGTSEYIRTNVTLTQLCFEVMQGMQVPFDADFATRVLAAITDVSDSFTNQAANADLFELASVLMRAGAQKPQLNRPQERDARPPMHSPANRQPMRPQDQPARTNPNQSSRPAPSPQPPSQQSPRPPMPARTPTQQPTPASRPNPERKSIVNPNQAPRPAEQSKSWIDAVTLKTQEPTESEAQDFEGTAEAKAQIQPSQAPRQNRDQGMSSGNIQPTDTQAPQDWLKPKIFKGGGFI